VRAYPARYALAVARTTLLVLALAALIAAGCGGDDDDNGDTEAERAAYIERADRICAEARVKLAENGREIAALARETQQGELAPKAYFRESGNLIEDSAQTANEVVEELEALPRPEADADALERYLAVTREQVKYLSDQAEATTRGDQAEIAKLNAQSNQNAARAQAAASDYGFKVCGSA
jgi:hypothetical protein